MMTTSGQGKDPEQGADQEAGLGRAVLLGVGVLTAVLLGLAAVLVLLFIGAPDLYPAAAYPDPAARASAISGTRTAAMAGFLGLAAVGTLAVNALNARTNTGNLRVATDNVRVAQRQQQTAQDTAQQTADATARTLDLTLSGQLTERYTAAVELLGKGDQMSVLGGLYALERLGADSSTYRGTAVQVISAYVRTTTGLASHQHAGAEQTPGVADREQYVVDGELPPHPNEPEHGVALLAALAVLGRIAPPAPADLVDLEALIPASRIAHTDAVRSGGVHADLRRTNLRRVELDGTDLRGVDFGRADLTEATFRFADLRFANFAGADLTRAQLTGAKLTGASFRNAWLNSAYLCEAKLGPGEYPVETVHFAQAHLDGTILDMADLRGAALGSVRGLTAEQLEYADGNGETQLPRAVPRPPDWPARA